jgi:hypothetical protein
MHKVQPEIKTISQDEDFPLSDITVVTIANTGNYVLRYSFNSGGSRDVKEGEEVSLAAGANTVFTSSATLKIRFVKPDVLADSDYMHATIIYNRLTESSRAFANLISK